MINKTLLRFFFKIKDSFKSLTPAFFSASEDDLFLVSYPRSGNTWMRAIMAEMIYGESGKGIKDLQFYVPDIHIKTKFEDVINSQPHIVKSHYTYQSIRSDIQYKLVIYIIRDPRDVVISHFNYVKKLREYAYDFDQFIYDWISGRIWPSSWSEHVNSWTGPGYKHHNINIYIVRYEDLMNDLYNQLERMVDFFDLTVTTADISRSIVNTSLEKMRLKEINGMREDEMADGYRFIDKAKPRRWEEELSPEQAELIISHIGSIMNRYGYN